MTLFGTKEQVGFGIKWTGDSFATAADASRGTLDVWIGGTRVWGRGPDGLEWTWVELLEHLGRFWSDLLLEERDPLDLGVDAEQLRSEAQRRWPLASGGREEKEEEALFAYLEAHDLAAGLMGVFPQSLFVTRQGRTLRFASGGRVVFVQEEVGETILADLGDAIAERLATVNDERARLVRQVWQEREHVEKTRLMRLVAGLDQAQVEFLKQSGIELTVANDFRAATRANELLAVARMSASSLPNKDIAALLSWVHGRSQVWTKPFDLHADAASLKLQELQENGLERAYEQGVEIARLFRTRLGKSFNSRIEPEEILSEWKVEVTDMRLSARHLDAVCTWGPKHGPAILVNKSGVHSRFGGRRATLAHEIGHLLMDRAGALPLGEVLGGSVPHRVEQRARAFAAELLMPQAAAIPAIQGSQDIEETVRELGNAFGCSRAIIAWQVRNGWGGPLPHDLYSQLRSMVEDPSRF